MPQLHYIKICGGLGNQLYLTAYAYYLKEKLGCRNITFYHYAKETGDSKDTAKRKFQNGWLDFLGFRYIKGHSWEFHIVLPLHKLLRGALKGLGLASWIKEPHLEQYIPLPLTPASFKFLNIHEGFFQSSAYHLAGFYDKVRAYYAQFSSPLTEQIAPNDVAVHLRRGDFTQPEFNEVFRTFGIDYYLRGLEAMEQTGAFGKVYVFSDDFSAIQSEVGALSARYDIVLVEGQTVQQDFALLHHFRRYVLANSTFSWWGAMASKYKEETVVMVPRQPLFQVHEADEVYPSSWIQLEG